MKISLKFITVRLLVIICMATAMLNLAAQDALLVHPAGGSEAQSFSLEKIQKITFSGDNMVLKTSSGDETLSLANIGKITFGEATGIPVVPVLPEIVLFPNPAVDFIRIDSPVDIKSWTLFNLNGKAIKHSGSELQIPVNDLPAGFYFLRLNTANGSVTKKFIKR